MLRKDHLWGFKEFAKAHSKYPKSANKKKYSYCSMKFMCQCKKGHMFDYRERELYPEENKHYAICQGKCPICGTPHFTFVSPEFYPI